MQSLIEILESVALSDVFIIDEKKDIQVSYGLFFSHALNYADYINANVLTGDVIAIKENSYELCLLYFAMIFTEKRLYVLDPQKGKKELIEIIGEIDSAGLIVDNDFFDVQDTKHRFLQLPNLEFVENDFYTVKNEIITRLLARKANLPYLVTFTSGTSGHTKGVEHTLENLILTAVSLDKKVLKRGGVFLHVMPMTYMAGILNSIFYPFLVGAKIVLGGRFSVLLARNFWDIVIKNEVDLFWLSPFMLMMIEKMDRKQIGEKYCRHRKPTFLIGTAPLTNELRQRFNERYGVQIYASYGLSETLFVSVETEATLKKSEKNCVGELLPGVEYIVSDEEEMLISVPWMYLRYINENTEAYFEGNYYKTGDLVKIIDDCLYIVGRSKDLIIRGGMNISPILIENIANSCHEIAESAVIGVQDKGGEERVCCAYSLRVNVEDIEELEAKIKKEVINQLGKNYMIDYMFAMDILPVNINGKVDKAKIKEKWTMLNE